MVDELLRDSRRAKTPSIPDELIDYYTQLISQDVANQLASDIVTRLHERLKVDQGPAVGRRLTGAAAECRDRRLRQALTECIAETLPSAAPLALKSRAGPTVVALVGPTGVGKTTTLAKLAANMKLRESKRVGLITLDTYRIAAVDQLKTYAEIMDLPLLSVVSPDEMKAAVSRLAGCDLVLIDTAGRSQRNAERIDELRLLMAAAEPDQVHLVLSGTAREDTIREAIDGFRPVGVNRLIFTKLDEALGFGVLLNVLSGIDLRLSYLTAGQSVPDDIEVGTAHRVACLILKQNTPPDSAPAPKRASIDVLVGAES